MRKFILIAIPVVILSAFVVLMTGGEYLKKPMSERDNVPKYIDLLRDDIINERWDKAREDIKKFESAWVKVTPRIQFSVDRGQIQNLEISMARLKGSITAQDKNNSMAELSEIHELWDELGK